MLLKIKLPFTRISFAIMFLFIAPAFTSVLQKTAYADPAVTSITCKDGTSVQATRAGATFTDADYQRACQNNGGYSTPTTPGATTECSGSSSDILEGCQATAIQFSKNVPTKICGSGGTTEDAHAYEVKVAFDFGCLGPAYGKPLNPIVDIAFAIFRFLSAGVGLVVIGSIIVAGIQYTASRGEPQAVQASIKRISNSVAALLLYIFIFAIANFLVPGGMFIK